MLFAKSVHAYRTHRALRLKRCCVSLVVPDRLYSSFQNINSLKDSEFIRPYRTLFSDLIVCRNLCKGLWIDHPRSNCNQYSEGITILQINSPEIEKTDNKNVEARPLLYKFIIWNCMICCFSQIEDTLKCTIGQKVLFLWFVRI